jgi:DNA-binding MarR family transcriptional regulator
MPSPEQVAALMAVQQRAAALGTVHADAIATRLGITSTDLKCLFLLLQRPRTPRELSTELRLTPSAITAVIDRMTKAGFACREPSTTDRRQVLVTVVPGRAEQATELYTPLFARISEVLARYDAAQIATLQDFAEQTVAALEEATEQLTAD